MTDVVEWRRIVFRHQGSLGKSAVFLVLLVLSIGDRTHVAAAGCTGLPTVAMTESRSDFISSRLQDGRVLVTGGWYNASLAQGRASAEIYDPGTGTWTSAGTMSTPRLYNTATLL